MTKVQVHVGNPSGMGNGSLARANVPSAASPCATHVTFLDLETMQAALSTRRLELLRHLRQHGATSTRSLAEALGRDYKNVHGDVATLEAAGLLVRDSRKLAAPWDELQASVMLG